jgi:hypothetical protein
MRFVGRERGVYRETDFEMRGVSGCEVELIKVAELGSSYQCWLHLIKFASNWCSLKLSSFPRYPLPQSYLNLRPRFILHFTTSSNSSTPYLILKYLITFFKNIHRYLISQLGQFQALSSFFSVFVMGFFPRFFFR